MFAALFVRYMEPRSGFSVVRWPFPQGAQKLGTLGCPLQRLRRWVTHVKESLGYCLSLPTPINIEPKSFYHAGTKATKKDFVAFVVIGAFQVMTGTHSIFSTFNRVA